VIKTGVVRIVERDVDGERLIATHGPRSFIGDVDMLTGRSSLFVAIANEAVEAFQLCSSKQAWLPPFMLLPKELKRWSSIVLARGARLRVVQKSKIL